MIHQLGTVSRSESRETQACAERRAPLALFPFGSRKTAFLARRWIRGAAEPSNLKVEQTRYWQGVSEGQCPSMAHSGHPSCRRECLLSGIKRTSLIRSLMSINDPKRTLAKSRRSRFRGTSRMLALTTSGWSLGGWRAASPASEARATQGHARGLTTVNVGKHQCVLRQTSSAHREEQPKNWIQLDLALSAPLFCVQLSACHGTRKRRSVL